MRPLSETRAAARRAPSRLMLEASRMARRVSAHMAALEDLPLPRFRLVAGGLLSATIAYGVVLGGHQNTVVDTVGEELGFGVSDIVVDGDAETSEIDILQAIQMTGASTLLSLDVSEARHQIEGMPWVDRASVSKVFPGTVKISLWEHEPYAIWQHQDRFAVVDRLGRIIVPFTPGRYADLPLVVGQGAGDNAAELLDDMEGVPELRARVRAYIRVGDRRWDVRLKDGKTISLPEESPVDALYEVARMDETEGLLSRDIETVDMRLPDRIVIELSPEAMERHEEALEMRRKLVAEGRRNDPV